MNAKHTFINFFLSALLLYEGSGQSLRITKTSSGGNASRCLNKDPIQVEVQPPEEDRRCPPAVNIYPCVCRQSPEGKLQMICSDVESEEQLESIFSTDFPTRSFFSFTMFANKNLKVLRSDALGNTSFQEIHIGKCSLKEIESFAFDGSYDTAYDLQFYANSISIFPFDDVRHFTKLKRFAFRGSNLTSFPTIQSSTLEYLSLIENDFGAISGEALQKLPQLQEVYLGWAGISEISNGTFTRLPHLRAVQLRENHLTEVPAGAIDLHNNYQSYVSFDKNNITDVAVGAIKDVSYYISLNFNSMTELKEDVWGSLVGQGCQIGLQENPLSCGCDMAWLVLNRTLVHNIYGNARCPDGQLVVDLDPSVYEDMCSI